MLYLAQTPARLRNLLSMISLIWGSNIIHVKETCDSMVNGSEFNYCSSDIQVNY